jgi:hypothetical protein
MWKPAVQSFTRTLSVLENKPERFLKVKNPGPKNDCRTMNNAVGTNLNQVKKGIAYFKIFHQNIR